MILKPVGSPLVKARLRLILKYIYRAMCFGCMYPILICAQGQQDDSLNLKAALNINGFYQGGNVQTWIFRAASDLRYRPGNKWVYATRNSFVYQAFGREKADQDFLSLNFLYFDSDRKIYPQLIGIASTNFRRKIRVRYLTGFGLRYQILDHKNNWLKFSISAEYEWTYFFETDFALDKYDGLGTIQTPRGTAWLSGRHQILKDRIWFRHESYVQPSLSNWDNYRWRSDIGIELPFWKIVSFNISYIHTFESIVIAEQRRQDQLLTFGLTLRNK